MNPANGLAATGTSFNGIGNAYPMFGTGQTIYGQAGFLLPKNILKDAGTLMPYLSGTYSKYQRLNDPTFVWNAGINWFIKDHTSKLTLDYQQRPVYDNTDLKVRQRKSTVTLQYQVMF